MPIASYNYNAFGLDISDRSLKCVELRRERNSNTIQAWNETNLEEGLFINGRVKNTEKISKHISELVKNANGKITTRYVSACLPESKSFIKLITLPKKQFDGKKSKEEIDRVIRNILPQHIPIPLEEVRVDWQITPQVNQDDTMSILVGAVPKSIIEEYSSILRGANLIPTTLEIEAQSITRALYFETKQQKSKMKLSIDTKKILKFFKKKYNNKDTKIEPNSISNAEEKNPTPQKSLKPVPKKIDQQVSNPTKTNIIIDLGASRTSLVLWSNNIIQFTSSIDVSGTSLTRTISDKMKLSVADAEKMKKICGLDPKKCKGEVMTILEDSLKKMVTTIAEMTTFYNTHFKSPHKIDEILLCGGGANMKYITSELGKKTGIVTSLSNPMIHINKNSKIQINNKKQLGFTTAIGLALKGKI